jgi:hypothetical protein
LIDPSDERETLTFKRSFFGTLKRKEGVILIFCLLAGLSLRFYAFDQKSLWVDEIYTLNDSRDSLKGQLEFYGKNPSYPQAPLFFALTHLFSLFSKPEKELRIFPVLFGALSIPALYYLARLFSPSIAIPCTISLTLMTYHISLSQDARSYSLLMFLATLGLSLLMKYLVTLRKRYLVPGAFVYALLFYTSYSSLPFLAFSQILWLYRTNEERPQPSLSAFFTFNALLLFFCAPWALFLFLSYTGQPLTQIIAHPFDRGEISVYEIIYGIFHDWMPFPPLMILSALFFVFSLFTAGTKRNSLLFLTILFLPLVSLYIFCKWINIQHHFASRYFICFLPLFLIALYLSIQGIECNIRRYLKTVNLTGLFLFLLIASNLALLPLYYRSEKQDYRRLATFLKLHLQEGDKIIDADGRLVGLLYYLGVPVQGRFYFLDYRKFTQEETEFRKSFVYQNRVFTIYYSKTCCSQYLGDGKRLWILAERESAEWLKENTPSVAISTEVFLMAPGPPRMPPCIFFSGISNRLTRRE